MWHAAKDHSNQNDGEGKEKMALSSSGLGHRVFIPATWVRVPLESPLEFGRTLLPTKTAIIAMTTWGVSTRD